MGVEWQRGGGERGACTEDGLGILLTITEDLEA